MKKVLIKDEKKSERNLIDSHEPESATLNKNQTHTNLKSNQNNLVPNSLAQNNLTRRTQYYNNE
jgi:hypothetical protein